MNTVVNLGGEYTKFCRVQNQLAASGYGDPNKYIIQPKTLRLEQLLSTQKEQYEFNLYETPDAGRPQEIKLSRNDMFAISKIGIGVYKQNTANDPAEYANTPIWTYPDTNFFTGSVGGTGMQEALCLYLVWRGKLSLFTDPVQRIKDFSTMHCEYIPERPYTEAAFVGYTNEVFPQWGPTDAERGFYELGPMPVLYGQQKNRITLTLGNGNKTAIDGAVDSAGDAVDTRNVLCVFLQGFNVENAAEAAGLWGTL